MFISASTLEGLCAGRWGCWGQLTLLGGGLCFGRSCCCSDSWDSLGYRTVWTNIASWFLFRLGDCVCGCVGLHLGGRWGRPEQHLRRDTRPRGTWCDVKLFCVKIKATIGVMRCVRHSNGSTLITLDPCLVHLGSGRLRKVASSIPGSS